MKLFSVAIKDCWASTVENIRDADSDNADDDTGGVTFDVTGGGAQTVKFYETMCPKYNWVTSFGDHSTILANTEIELRQFMFNGDGGGEFFYHCEVYQLYTVYLNK